LAYEHLWFADLVALAAMALLLWAGVAFVIRPDESGAKARTIASIIVFVILVSGLILIGENVKL
jgi:hypothetical protein